MNPFEFSQADDHTVTRMDVDRMAKRIFSLLNDAVTTMEFRPYDDATPPHLTERIVHLSTAYRILKS